MSDETPEERPPEPQSERPSEPASEPPMGEPPAPEPPNAPGPFPWPPRPGAPALDALVKCWQGAVFEPTRFFRALPVPGPLGAAVLYYLVVGIAAAAINLFWGSLFRYGGVAAWGWGASARGGWAQLLGFLFAPLTLLIALLVSSIVLHVVLALVGGAHRPLATTARVICYAYSPALFVIVPVLGGIIGGVWTIVLTIIGLSEAHRTERWRAALAFFLPAIVLGIFILAVAALTALVSSFFGGR